MMIPCTVCKKQFEPVTFQVSAFKKGYNVFCCLEHKAQFRALQKREARKKQRELATTKPITEKKQGILFLSEWKAVVQ